MKVQGTIVVILCVLSSQLSQLLWESAFLQSIHPYDMGILCGNCVFQISFSRGGISHFESKAKVSFSPIIMQGREYLIFPCKFG
jgi:hypothetical protein